MSLSTYYGSFISCLGIACPCGREQDKKSDDSSDADLESGPQDDTININMHIYQPSIDASATFAAFKDKVSKWQHLSPHAPRFDQLMYLATLQDNQSPFCESDQIAFKRSFISDKTTKIWLRIGGVAAAALPILTAIPIISWSFSLTQDHPLITTVSLTGAVAAGMISWISTGSNPDFKSDSANDRQDVLGRLPKMFDQIAKELIDLKYSHPLLAKEIATALEQNLGAIEKQMCREDPKSLRSPPDLMVLEVACREVLGGELPDRAPLNISTYILLKRLQFPPKSSSSSSSSQA